MNHLTFFSKFCVYNARSSGYLNIEYLKAIIDKAKNIEREISKHQPNKRSKYLLSGVFLLNAILTAEWVGVREAIRFYVVFYFAFCFYFTNGIKIK